MKKLSYVFYLVLAFVLTSCHNNGRAGYKEVEKLKIGMNKTEVEDIINELQTFDRINDSTYVYGYWAEHPNYIDYILKVTYVNDVAIKYER